MSNMYDIILNDEIVVKGKISIAQTRVNKGEEVEIVVTGQLVTHRYFEEIDSIETERYLLKNVDVHQELFGSTDFNIIYSFTAGSLEVKYGQSNLKSNEIEEIESSLYKEDDTYGGVKNE